MANPDVGYIDCPQCGLESPVRWQKGVVGTKLYYACKNCGQFFPRMDGGQAFIKANMRPITPENPEPEPVAKPEPEKQPELEQKEQSAWAKFWEGDE